MKRSWLVIGSLLLGAAGSASADGVGVPVDSKFAAYGGPNFDRVTELRGTVMWVSGSEFFVAPDSGYQNLLVTGNIIQPPDGEYNPQEFPNLDSIWQPIIKLEANGVGPDPGIDTPYSPLVHDSAGNSRPIAPGDHIVVNGLYAIDYAHTMYEDTCTSTFSYMRGVYKACYAHAEIHPYDYNNILLLAPIAPGGLVSESHTLAAPVYTDYYSQTYFTNKIAGLAGSLVVPSMQSSRTADFNIQAPPQPDMSRCI